MATRGVASPGEELQVVGALAASGNSAARLSSSSEYLLKIIFCVLQMQPGPPWWAPRQPGVLALPERAAACQSRAVGRGAAPPTRQLVWSPNRSFGLQFCFCLNLHGFDCSPLVILNLEQNQWIPSDIIAYRFMGFCGFFIKHVVKRYKMKP